VNDNVLEMEFITMQLLSNLSDEHLGNAAHIFVLNNTQHMPSAFSMLIVEMARRLRGDV
jgi:hypothetical protein